MGNVRVKIVIVNIYAQCWLWGKQYSKHFAYVTNNLVSSRATLIVQIGY